MLHRTQQKDKIHCQALQNILFTKHQLLHLLKLNNGFQVTDTLSHLKAIHGGNSLREKVGLMWVKKRLRKYRTSDQQFNTCSAVSCIYWTVDATIGSAVFVTTLRSTHALIPLWGWKTCKSHSTDLSIYEEEGGKKEATWTDKWHYLWWGRGIWNPESRLESLYPLLHTLFTQLWPNHTKSDQKTWTNSWWPTGGICDPWGHNVHVHPQNHTCVTGSRAPHRLGRQDPAAGMGGRTKGIG